MSEITYEEFCATLPEAIRNDRAQLLNVCQAAKVEVPLSERFYVRNHTPKSSPRNPNPQPTDYVVVPNPRPSRESRDLWVRKAEFANFLQAGIEFAGREGIVDTDED